MHTERAEGKSKELDRWGLPLDLLERGFEINQRVEWNDAKLDDPLASIYAGKIWTIMGFLPDEKIILLKQLGEHETMTATIPEFLELFQRVAGHPLEALLDEKPEPEPKSPLEELLN